MCVRSGTVRARLRDTGTVRAFALGARAGFFADVPLRGGLRATSFGFFATGTP